MKSYRLFLSLLMIALSMLMQAATAQSAALRADDAFVMTLAQHNASLITIHWTIKPGYHLYRDSIKIKAIPEQAIHLGPLQLPAGTFDKHAHPPRIFYTQALSVQVPLLNNVLPTATFDITYQGCKDQQYCFAPIIKRITVPLTRQPTALSSASTTPKHFVWWILSYFSLGCLLAFTPCVLPMIPILSGIILGQKNRPTTQYAFLLTLTYVLSMAATYAVTGLIAGYVGIFLQEKLQNPKVLISFSLLFLFLALSLFGAYAVQLPRWLRNKFNRLNGSCLMGSYCGAAIMGSSSILIVSPCISAPLAAALAYMSTTGNIALGAITLFMLGLGIGTPLLVFATVGSRYLPKSGAWMQKIKILLGILLLLLAGLTALRAIPEKFIAQIFHQQTIFKTINTLADLKTELKNAKAAHTPVLIDYYADWCTTCREMDLFLFNQANIRQLLRNFKLLRIDVTQEKHENRVLSNYYAVFAPPTMVFINAFAPCPVLHKIAGPLSSAKLAQQVQATLQPSCIHATA